MGGQVGYVGIRCGRRVLCLTIQVIAGIVKLDENVKARKEADLVGADTSALHARHGKATGMVFDKTSGYHMDGWPPHVEDEAWRNDES